MPKTRNFSALEKRDAMDLLDIHDDINAVHLLTGISHRTLRRWRKQLLRRKNTTLSEKSFSLSAKRTMSDNAQTNQQSNNNLAQALDAANQPPAHANAALQKSYEDLQRLRHIRDQLMDFASGLASNLDPDDPDVNLRTMSLVRALDRIHWLDENLYDGDEKPETPQQTLPPNRMEFVDSGQLHGNPAGNIAYIEQEGD